MVSKRYCLAPWELVGEGQDRPPGWNPPVGYSSVVDLRNRSDMGQLTLGDRPYGFFAGDSSLSVPSGAELLGTGDCRDILTTTDVQNTWQGLMGYRPQGTRLVDLLWDQLTDGADADGVTSVAPLVPNHLGITELHLSGHSVVRTERFGDIRGNGRWATTLTKQLQNQFARTFARNQELAEKVLGNSVAKYRLGSDWRHIVPANLLAHTQGPRKPTTSISDGLTGSGNMDVGPWEYPSSKVYAYYATGAGTGIGNTPGSLAAAHTTDLSSDDHEAEAEWLVNDLASSGIAWRIGDATLSTQDCYYSQRFGGQVYLSKVVNGSASNISNTTQSITIGDVDLGRADGTTVEIDINSTNKISVTDTSLTGQLQCGILITSRNSAALKNFAASDLAAGAATSSNMLLLGVG